MYGINEIIRVAVKIIYPILCLTTILKACIRDTKPKTHISALLDISEKFKSGKMVSDMKLRNEI